MASIIVRALDCRPASLQSTLQGLQALKSEGYTLIGCEVLNKDVRALLGHNYDPQHQGGRSDTSAIAEVYERFGTSLSALALSDQVALIIEKPDADSVGAAAVISLSIEGKMPWIAGYDGGESVPCPDFRARVMLVNEHDCRADAAAKDWQPELLETQLSREAPLGAILALVADFKVSIEERVRMMQTWLLTGEEPAAYRTAYDKDVAAIRRSLADGSTEVVVQGGDGDFPFVVVMTSLRAGTRVGYAHAPVVIVTNGSGLVTICQHRPGYVDLKKVADGLNRQEPDHGGKPGWGGSPTIVGSPKPEGTKLPLVAVTSEVLAHLSRNHGLRWQ